MITHKEIGAKVLADFAEATQDIAIIEQRAKKWMDAKCLCNLHQFQTRSNCHSFIISLRGEY